MTELSDFHENKLKWLRYACILQGCDYFPSGLKGVGIKTGIKHLKTAIAAGATHLEQLMTNPNAYLPAKTVTKWEKDDMEAVIRADECFRYQAEI